MLGVLDQNTIMFLLPTVFWSHFPGIVFTDTFILIMSHHASTETSYILDWSCKAKLMDPFAVNGEQRDQ